MMAMIGMRFGTLVVHCNVVTAWQENTDNSEMEAMSCAALSLTDKPRMMRVLCTGAQETLWFVVNSKENGKAFDWQ